MHIHMFILSLYASLRTNKKKNNIYICMHAREYMYVYIID